MPRRPLRAAGALLAAGALVLTGCAAGSDEPAPTSTAAADPEASVAIRLVLEPGNLDIRQTAGAALDQILIDNVYQGLVSRTADQEIVPTLAESYEVSDDGLTYTFDLREGVTFHDGQELTADDVVWSLETRRDTPEWRDSARLSNVESITAEDGTVTLTLSAPDSTLLWNLTGRAGIILKEDDGVDYQTDANGTGPFVLDDWLQGDSITFTRNDTYWGDPAGVAEVYFDYIPDNQAALNAALAGEVDVVTGFDATLGEQIEAGGDFALVLGESTDKGTLAFNQTEDSPLADQRVRQAVRQAIDHDAFIEAAQSGQPLYGPIPSLDPGYEDLSDVAPYDPEAARELLAEADAEDLELTLTIPNFYPTTIPQILVSNLNEVGITLEVESVDFPTWLNDVYTNRDYELSFVLHTEAHDFENWANPDYYFTYDNPEVQELYAQSVAATDPAEAEAFLAEAARIVSEDAAADWLYNGASVLAVGANISNMPSTNVNERLNLSEITKSDG
ncbi:ABC transporter substrate-binding protein [Microbacterium xanthum]|uniref:ABC transporter substrate-binding protein n=1 Tax=Microbacterium xanthum TaxID=3079794 RepID=UPI002AD449F5|nr:ABC transporter substrate-binding protein [Microbacterium sp. KSW-48]MDZ8171138.1 ABC transporter substrate-binding protein [Microbacterium sp. KSW-48]